MKFIDEVTILIQGGQGGNGCLSFRREKFIPWGGPNGGDGGRGGDVILEASPHLSTLLEFTFKPNYAAEAGVHGKGSMCHGKRGEPLILRVPCGTMVKDEDGQIVVDLVVPGTRFVAAKGGRGGWGNAHFATPTRQAPTIAIPGNPGTSTCSPSS